jgi:hypothetical protein
VEGGVKDALSLVVKIVEEFQQQIRANPLSRETCIVIAFRKGSNETTLQTIKRIPKRVASKMKGSTRTPNADLLTIYNPKIREFRSIYKQNVTSAIVRGTLYVTTFSNAI